MDSLFDDLDKLELRLAGRNWMPNISNIIVLRKRVFTIVIVCATFWALLGWDSTWEMIFPIERMLFTDPLGVIPSLLNPESQLRQDMLSYYGLGDHWSMPVMYGITAIWLSLRMEKRGVVKSMNFFTTAGIMMMVGGVFEFVWNRLYGMLHDQPFVYTFAWGTRQMLNLSIFAFMILLGVFALMILMGAGYRFSLRRYKVKLVVLSATLWLLWIFYPHPFTRINAMTQWGLWESGPLFPQTMYAIKISDTIVKGFFVENNWLHLLNVATKWVWTVTGASLCVMEKRQDA